MSLGAKFNLIGRLVADPKTVTNGRGNQTAFITIAVDKGYRDNQTGQWVERADFLDVIAYGDNFVAMLANVYKKGTLVAVEGEIGTRKIKVESGHEQTIPALRIENIMKLSFNKNVDQGQAQDQGFNDQGFENNGYDQGYQNQGGYGNLPPQR